MWTYAHERPDWPNWVWDGDRLLMPVAAVRHRQGLLAGRLSTLGVTERGEATLEVLTEEVIKTSEIEGEILNTESVRSSIAWQLGLDFAGAAPPDREVEGIVAMMLDATYGFDKPLTADRLFNWHGALFPTGRNRFGPIRVGGWRGDEEGRTRVISGAMGRERVHYEAPPAQDVPGHMARFIEWFEGPQPVEAVIRAGVAHAWFELIHPFDDGNGRIGRAIMELALARAESSPQRNYSVSAQIRRERASYYAMLEATGRGDLDATLWLEWFLGCLDRAIEGSEQLLSRTLTRARFWQHYRDTPLNQRQRKILTLLLGQFEGALTNAKWVKLTKSSPGTALRDIQELLELGILRVGPSQGRSTHYILVLPGEERPTGA